MRNLQGATTRWATFDCYGTLVDWEGGMSGALEMVVPGDVSALLARYYELEPETQIERPVPLYRDVLARTLRRAADSLQIPLAPGDERILEKTFPGFAVFPDVGPAFRELKEQGWSLAILSNIDKEMIAQTLQSFPVVPDLVVTAEEVQSYKPGLPHFQRFQEITSATRQNWVHVACSYFHDIIPASQLGLSSVWIDRGHLATAENLATVTLPDLTLLPETLARLVPA